MIPLGFSVSWRFHAKHFPKEFMHAPSRRSQRLSAQRSYPVHAPRGFPVALQVRTQIGLVLQAVQDGIKRSRAQLVPMPSQFLGDPNSVKRLFRGVVKNVQANQPRVETLIIHIVCRCPVSISKSNIEQQTTICQLAMRAQRTPQTGSNASGSSENNQASTLRPQRPLCPIYRRL